MNELPRRKLSEIVARHGRSIIADPRRIEALLRDYCGAYRREISVLVSAVEEHAVSDLLAARDGLPQKVLLARLTQRLCDNLGLAEDAARWSIETWALALGVISVDAGLPRNSSAQTEKAAAGRTQTSSSTPQTIVAAKPAQPQPQVDSLIVDANGTGHFRNIGDALKNVAPGARLIVREGVYDESLVLDKTVEIIGEGAFEKTIVRSFAGSCLQMRTDRALVRGLTLQGRGAQHGKAFFAVEIAGGELVLEKCDITSDSLSGVAVRGAAARPLIKNCLVRDCSDSGFYIFDRARPRIENCDIYRNTNVGVAITGGAVPSIKKCRVFEGRNGGIVVWGKDAAGVIEDCEIYAHRLANVGVREDADPTFRRCSIRDGSDTGVFVHQNGFGTFEECDIYQNSQAEVAISQNAESIFRRCSVHHGENCGVILQNRGRALIESCNIYDNRDAGVALYGASEAVVLRSNVHRNGKVAVRIVEGSAARVENSDLRGNFAAWETEYGVTVEESGNRDE